MSVTPPTLSQASDRELLPLIADLLARSEYQDNPLLQPLQHLYTYCHSQQERMERLVRISDGYHSIGRNQSLTLAEQYDKQLRRLAKLARISDRYQNSLREMSEALKVSALHDALTGLDNRRALTERLREESERAARKRQVYSLAIIDVDRFKRINDRYGHDAGDKALCAIADAIRQSLREYDVCGRWGGEEFMVLLPDTSVQYAVQVIERIRAGVEQLRVELAPDDTPTVTASFGLTQHRLGEDFSTTVNRADTLLLTAKERGRNRIVSG